ncbi:MAG: hypothetical protein JNL50_12730 [Phycisphaerae bacterium]|nr:hypothetical protein [Phycisphaerae bacterium]
MPVLFKVMAASFQSGPVLRLVNADAALDHRPSPPGTTRPSEPRAKMTPSLANQHGATSVATENRAAAGLSALDARWVFAVQVARTLDGGQAAVLSPEKRRELIGGAVRMGLRAFDANLVIAIVQDAARRGESPLSRQTEFCLKLVKAPSDEGSEGWNWMLIIGMALLLAGGALAGLLVWLRT